MSSYQPPAAASQPLPHFTPQPTGAPPVWAPWYGITFFGAIRRFFAKYADFSGRASLSEYWWASLFIYIVFSVLLAIMLFAASAIPVGTGNDPSSRLTGAKTDMPVGPAITLLATMLVAGMFALACIVPRLALGWRRLHDVNLPGPLYLVSAAFLPGAIFVLVLTLFESKPTGRRFDRPRGVDHTGPGAPGPGTAGPVPPGPTPPWH